MASLLRVAGVILVVILLQQLLRQMIPTPALVQESLRFLSSPTLGSADLSAAWHPQALAGFFSWVAIVPIGALIVSAASWVTRGNIRASSRASSKSAIAAKGGLAAISVGWLFACSWVVRSFAVASSGLDVSGWALVLYHVCRLSLGGYTGMACILTGEAVGLASPGWLGPLGERRGKYVLYKFFIGASVLSLTGSLLAVAGVLSLPVVLLILLPAALFAPFWIFRDAVPATVRALQVVGRSRPGAAVVRAFLLAGVLIAAGLMIVVRVIYPATTDGDVWEHYLHYYREVAASGSAGPSEIWYHYYLSKGAGLSFIAAVSGDILTIPAVSACFAFASSYCVYRLGRHLMRNSTWSLAAAAVALTAYTADASGGAFFKHHLLFAGYVSFFLWSLTRYPAAEEDEKRVIWIACFISAVFIGYHLLIPSAIVVLALALVLPVSLLWRDDFRKLPATLVVGIAVGCATSVTINFAATGLPYDIPAALFWKFSDQERFADTVGLSGLMYFMFVKNDFGSHISPYGHWLSGIFRWEYFAFVFSRVGLLIGTACCGVILLFARKKVSSRALPGVVIAASLLVATLVFALAAQVLTVGRLSIYVVAPMAILSVGALGLVLDMWPSARTRGAIGGIVLVLIAARAIAKAIEPDMSHKLIYAGAYASGTKSTNDVLEDLASATNRRGEYQFLSDVRKHITGNRRILMLCSTTGPAYAFPGRGLVSEPTYSLGQGIREVMYGSPEDSELALRRLGIDYFLLKLAPEEESPLFSSVVFGPLFAPGEITKRLAIAASREGTYLLTWRQPSDTTRLPDEFLVLLELRRGAVFDTKLWPHTRDAIREIADMEASAPTGAGGRVNSYVTRLLESISLDIGRRELTKRSQEQVRKVVEDVRKRLPDQLAPTLRKWREAHERERSPFDKASREELQKELFYDIRFVLLDRSQAQFGNRAGNALVGWEDYYPFGALRDSQFSAGLLDRFYGPSRENKKRRPH